MNTFDKNGVHAGEWEKSIKKAFNVCLQNINNSQQTLKSYNREFIVSASHFSPYAIKSIAIFVVAELGYFMLAPNAMLQLHGSLSLWIFFFVSKDETQVQKWRSDLKHNFLWLFFDKTRECIEFYPTSSSFPHPSETPFRPGLSRNITDLWC